MDTQALGARFEYEREALALMDNPSMVKPSTPVPGLAVLCDGVRP